LERVILEEELLIVRQEVFGREDSNP